MAKPKILILGHGRHGKDTVAEIISDDLELTFKGSSEAANELFIFETLKDKYGYKTPEECHKDRGNHREEWRDLIVEFNTPDKAKLAKYIALHWDGYVGMRSREEFRASYGIFDEVIWVFNYRQGIDRSMDIEFEEAKALARNFTMIRNDETIKSLRSKIRLYCVHLRKKYDLW